MQRILPEIRLSGAELVAISPELPDNTLSMEEKNGITFHLLSDLGNSYARQCGLVQAGHELRGLHARGRVRRGARRHR